MSKIKYPSLTTFLLVTQAVVSMVGYFVLFIFIPRNNFIQFFSIFSILFISYYFLVKNISLKQGIGLAILLRIIALLSTPELSDDFYRFIWDGALTVNNINPYLYTPQHAFNTGLLCGKNFSFLIEKMNSPNYFTVYPPLNQFLFAASVFIFGSAKGLLSAVGIKFWIFLAEIGTILLLPKVLKSFDIAPENALLYTLNPLVIIELCGNGHYEGVMIFLLLLSVYVLQSNKWGLSAIVFGLAVSIKLVPLLFIPLLFRKIGFIKLVLFSFIAISVNVILFIPYASQEFLSNLGSSIHLYFNSFQFNSFIYAIISDVLAKSGLPESSNKIVAPLLMLFPVAALAWFSLSKKSMLKNLPSKISTTQGFYYFFSAVVHPWYLTTVLAFSTFQPVKYILVWSYVVGLSYFTYRTLPYEESSILIALEYLLVFMFLFIDWIILKRKRYLAQ